MNNNTSTTQPSDSTPGAPKSSTSTRTGSGLGPDIGESYQDEMSVARISSINNIVMNGTDSDAEAHEIQAPQPEEPQKWHQRRSILLLLIVIGVVVTIVIVLFLTKTIGAPALTPVQIACNFIGQPSSSDCRTTLHVDYYSIQGSTIPSEIGLLGQLTHLNAYMNGLTGSIPSSISQLTRLTYLNFMSNEFLTGTIPSL